jgi:hypothetical protein
MHGAHIAFIRIYPPNLQRIASMIVKDLFMAKDSCSYGRVGFQGGHLGRVVAAKCPKYYHYMVKIEKILGVSAPIAAVSP